jgi:TRAP-type C4-dicarboxylate transport system permease small subunit
MMMLVLFEVVMRYVVHQPPIVADEVSAYMLVALSFIGLAYTWKERGHVRITALVSRLPARVSSWIRLVMLFMALGISVMLTRASYEYLAFSFKIHMTSATHLRVPLQGPQTPLFIGFALLTLLLVVEVAKAIVKLRAGQKVEEATV